ncbi:MAG: M28 family peptidase [Bacteroidota bacterium]
MKKLFVLFSGIILMTATSVGQTVFDFSPASVEARIYHDVAVLASDSFQGREAGTEGELKSREYIRNAFENAGLKPILGYENYFQPFRYLRKIKIGNECNVKSGTTNFVLYTDYYVSAFSGSGELSAKVVDVGSGLVLNDGKRNDYEGLSDLNRKIFRMCVNFPSEMYSVKENENFLTPEARINKAREMGASAILFYNNPQYPSGTAGIFDWINNTCVSIPVIYLSAAGVSKLDSIGGKELSLNIFMEKDVPETNNVIGWIDNKADRVIYIGAHYDHMGYQIKDGKKSTFYGADDNASGTAAVMELARYLSQKGPKDFNYIFLAFAAEEKGLLGSEQFCKTCLTSKTGFPQNAYYINFDMVGRLGCVGNKVMLMGTGSSKQWKGILKRSGKNSFRVKKVKASIDASDQVCFKRNHMPYLYFTTGLHKQYHKPLDQIKLINAEGEAGIVMYTERIILGMSGVKTITFRKSTGFQIFKAYLTFGLMMF